MNTNTDNSLTAEQLSRLTGAIKIHGYDQARAFLNGECSIGAQANLEVQWFYDKWREKNLPAPLADEVVSKQWDLAYDSYMEGFKSAFLPVSSDKELLRQAREALEPFSHEDLRKIAPSMTQGDESPVYGRNGAILRIGDFARAASTLKKLQSATR